MTETNDTEDSVKITFSNGNCCSAETEEYSLLDIDIDNMTKLSSKKGNQIKKFPKRNVDIDWDNEELTVEYPNGTKYNGKINRNGKQHGKGKLTYKNRDVYEGDFVNGEQNGRGIYTWADGDVYDGNWVDGKRTGRGIYTWADGDVYDGNWVDGEQTGKGKFTAVNEETKEHLYTHVYDENGIMNNVEYLYEEGNPNRLAINYYEINEALNKKEINNPEDLMKYMFICDKNGNKIAEQSNCNIELIKQCAQYQMQNKLKGNSNELNDENRIDCGYTGLQNLIVLAELNNNIDALRRTRFEIKQNNPDWPTNTYNNIELYLNSLGLTRDDNPSENSDLVSIHSLNTDYLSINMATTAEDHTVSGIIDLNKIKQNKKDYIYVYDSSRVIDNRNKERDLGNLQPNCQFYNHFQQELGSCWYHASCSTITAAEHPEIIEKIRSKEILSIPTNKKYVKNNTEFNDFELLQMIKLQEVAEDLGVGRLGRKTREQELTNSGNRPRMTHQIVNYDTREAIKKIVKEYTGKIILFKKLWDRLTTFVTLFIGKIFGKKVKKYNEKSSLLENLGIRLGTYMSLKFIAEKRGLLNNKILKSSSNQLKNNKLNQKLLEIEAKNSKEVNERLLNGLEKTIHKNNKGKTDNDIKELLQKATNELNSLTLNTRIELLKKVEKG